jgi:hypothetical protein
MTASEAYDTLRRRGYRLGVISIDINGQLHLAVNGLDFVFHEMKELARSPLSPEEFHQQHKAGDGLRRAAIA